MREVCVVGAGVIGITTAWYLAQAGCKVTLIDKANNVGTGTSYMNGGQLSYRYVSPLADAGVPIKAIKWLLQKDGPLRFTPQADWQQWSWLVKFLMHCQGSVNRKTTQKLVRLGQYSRACMNELMNEHRIEGFGWRESGKLVVYRDQSGFARAGRSIVEGDTQQLLTADECVQLEPGIATLHHSLAGGIYTPSEAVADCYLFCQSLQKKLNQHPNFVGMHYATAIKFEARPKQGLRLVTNTGHIDAAEFVLAAGIASVPLALGVGVRLPIYPLKGYSLNVPFDHTHAVPDISVTDFEKKVLYARIGSHLRIAAMVDMVGADERIDQSRVASLLRIARRDMPSAGNYDQAERWAGLRPATPSGAPIVGASAAPGLWLNVGHGALGFTFACGTASLLAELVVHGAQPKQLDGLSWQKS